MANNSKSVLEEIEDFEKVVEAPSASVHGVLTSISPVKKGKKGRKRNYFEGTVSDGTNKLRLVGFNSKLQKQMSDMMVKKRPVEIQNCEIKPSLRGDKMEILLKSNSAVEESTRSIDVPEVDFEDEVPEEIEVSKIKEKYVLENRNKMSILLTTVGQQK